MMPFAKRIQRCAALALPPKFNALHPREEE